MSAIEILADLYRQDIDLTLADDGKSLTVPAGRLTSAQRQLVLTHKPELIEFLQAAHVTTDALIAAAMRCCDFHRDSAAQREEMRADCEGTPAHLRADLLAHFEQTYSKATNENSKSRNFPR